MLMFLEEISVPRLVQLIFINYILPDYLLVQLENKFALCDSATKDAMYGKNNPAKPPCIIPIK